MTEIWFYIVADAQEDGAIRFACRLAEKIHGQGRRLYLHTGDPPTAARLDDLLWTFRQGSFVPHAMIASLDDEHDPTPVAIGAGTTAPPGFDDVLVNLAAEVPDFFSRFRRTVEIVTPDNREDSRQRYKFYQDRGYQLETHKVS